MIHGIRTKRRTFVCDGLLIIAVILNIASIVVRYKTVHYGLGRHMKDPSVDMRKYSYYYSICAYLLALKFSRVYLGIVWVSVAMITTFSLVVPMMSVFCSTPMEANWNKKVPGECFMSTGNVGLSWTQGGTNIFTDIVYVVAPIIYLSTIQLPSRTQWGLRVVFCLGLGATICSILKTIELPVLMKTKDPTWDSVRLAIWSGLELSVGILIASLPPLRKPFESLFHKIMPSTFINSRSKAQGPSDNVLPLYDVPFTIGTGAKGDRLRIDNEIDDDGDSERYILQGQTNKGGITRTIVNEVRSDDRNSVQVPDKAYNAYR
ncbi:hypothetical protein ACET3X_004401 [Alternaria dauci]|uniref:Rhodopsin domain-containing protein n=1 Tax=Alternaria dauci TaxID=48095 RepID=A0ABR3UP10_9PLEO